MHHLAPAPVRPAALPRPLRRERPSAPHPARNRDTATVAPFVEAGASVAEFELARAATGHAPVPRTLAPVLPMGSGGDVRPGPSLDLEDTADLSPSTLCATLARCVIEILAGARSLDQVARWVTDAVYVNLLRRNALAQRARQDSADSAPRPRVHIGDPKLSSPAKDVIESVVMVHQPARSRAVAIRLERHRSRWRASAINVL